LTIDHIVPVVRGGNDAIGNLCPACPDCNARKGDAEIIESMAIRLTEKAAVVAEALAPELPQPARAKQTPQVDPTELRIALARAEGELAGLREALGHLEVALALERERNDRLARGWLERLLEAVRRC
jgi:hypothetical protein